MSGDDAFPGEALEAIAYLARSENRVRVLAALADAPATRRDLEDTTGVARATVGRTLADAEDRGWVRSSGREYALTPAGERVVAEFTPLVDRMEAIQRLGDMVAWLPTDEVAIDLRHFRDATVRRPEPADPFAPVTHVTGLLEAASEFHCLVGVAPPLEFERAMRDGVVTGGLTTRHVMTAEEFEYLRSHPDRLARWREYVAGGANLYRYDGQVPCNVFVFDDTVLVGGGNTTESGAGAGGLVESENEAVRSWAHELIDRYQLASERLDPSAFDGPDSTDG